MNTYTALLYNESNAISLILLCIIFANAFNNDDIKAKFPSFKGFVISLFILGIGDIFWAFVNCGLIAFTEFWGYFTNLAFFVGTLISIFFLFMLSQDVYGYNGNYIKKALLLAIPFIIDLIFVCLTPITHMVFMYEGETYHRTSFYTLTLCIPYVYVVYMCVSSFIRSFKSKYFIVRRSLRIMSLYAFGTLLLSLFQLVSTNIFPLYVVGGALICVVIYIDSLSEFNTVDLLTKLHNSRSFENYLSELMEKQVDDGNFVYLILADINGFKSINEIYGHDEGDNVLTSSAAIISKSAPSNWFTARLGGDEFALVGECSFDEVDNICNEIYSRFDKYNMSSSKPFTVKVSIGYAALSSGCKSVTDYIKLAEKQLSVSQILSKQSNDQHTETGAFNQKTDTESNSATMVITQQDINLWMNSALKNGEFIPYFQPQVNISDGTISGAEALARWIHPEKGIIYPSLFIPVFERNGFIYEMDKSIWHSVCALIRKWKDDGIDIPPISVNASRWDVIQEDFIDVLLADLTEFNLKPADLHIEITESAYLFDQKYLINLMEKLQDLGFILEMDDFGSGYSSLTAFKDLPFNLIKLDSSLIRESTKTEKAGNILSGIVDLTKSLSMPLIAEGIEQEEQASFLKKIGCYNMQGYLFAKPMPADNFIEFVNDWKIKSLSTVQ